MDISVIISTRNRAARLPGLFDSFVRLEKRAGMTWELIMVDNGSTDETPMLIESEKALQRLPVVNMQEPVPGKSRALNLAIGESQGDLLIFTDDDVEFGPEWLKAYYEAANAHPEVMGFAGRVLPLWEGEIPGWLHTDGEFALPRGVINCRDFGEESHLLSKEIVPGGMNTALRKTAVQKMGEFRVDLGPGTGIPYAEDTEYMRRLLAIGGSFFYIPSALLFHKNSVERMTRSYVEKRIYEATFSQVVAFKHDSSFPMLFGVPRYLWYQAMQRFVSWYLDVRPPYRFLKKLRWMNSLGVIQGYRLLKQ